MSSLKERVEKLKHDLTQRPLRHAIYSDLPFAVFCYPPDEEWQMRGEIQRLKTRLERETDRHIHFISLADLLWQSIDESEGMPALIDVETRQGFDAAQKQAYDYLSDSDWRPLPDLLEEKLKGLNAERDLVFIERAGALAPDIYRVSMLLDQMKGRTRVPCVLFMPATSDDSEGLRFMGLSVQERRGSYHTKVYID
jgi:bacteriophage exclusion system BrxB-like protein